jgi:hypothetical protein
VPFQGKCNVCSCFTQRSLTDEHWRFTVINKEDAQIQCSTIVWYRLVIMQSTCKGFSAPICVYANAHAVVPSLCYHESRCRCTEPLAAAYLAIHWICMVHYLPSPPHCTCQPNVAHHFCLADPCVQLGVQVEI